MAAVADDALNSLAFQQMRRGSIMVARVQSHVDRQRAQAFFNFIQNFRQRRYVIDVGGFNVDIHDDVVFAVYCPVLAVCD